MALSPRKKLKALRSVGLQPEKYHEELSLKAERLRVKATILESGVAHTFKQYGEWTAECQAEISIEVLQDAVQLRKEAHRIADQAAKLSPGFRRRSRTRTRRRR